MHEVYVLRIVRPGMVQSSLVSIGECNMLDVCGQSFPLKTTLDTPHKKYITHVTVEHKILVTVQSSEEMKNTVYCTSQLE